MNSVAVSWLTRGILEAVRNRMGLLAESSSIALSGSDNKRSNAGTSPIALALLTFTAFISSFEPNLTLRYGPFLAVAAVLIANPLKLRIGAAEWLFVSLLAWAALSVQWGGRVEGSTSFLALAGSCVMFAGIRSAIRSRRDFRALASGFVLGACVGLARFALQGGSNALVYASGERITQVGDLNVNYVAYVSVSAIVIVASDTFFSGQLLSRARRLGAASLIVVLALGVLMTQTRGAILALALLGAWVLYVKASNTLRRAGSILAALFMIVSVSVAAGLLDSLLAGLDTGQRSVGQLSGRLDLWRIARENWFDNPILGIGFGGFRALNYSGLTAHNALLEIGATLGFVGAVLFVALVMCSIGSGVSGLNLRYRQIVLGLIVSGLAPIYLSGTWVYSAAAWTSLAVISALGVGMHEIRQRPR